MVVVTVEKVTAITATGVGRKDYSQQIEHSVEALIRSHLTRVAWAFTYNFPAGYTWALIGLPLGDLWPAPSTLYHLYDLDISLDKNVFVEVGFYEFLSLADYLAFNPSREFGGTCGYGDEFVNYVKGVKTIPGRYYAVLFINWDATGAAYSLRFRLNGLMETIAGVQP
jgi:hypothetical protein